MCGDSNSKVICKHNTYASTLYIHTHIHVHAVCVVFISVDDKHFQRKPHKFSDLRCPLSRSYPL